MSLLKRHQSPTSMNSSILKLDESLPSEFHNSPPSHPPRQEKGTFYHSGISMFCHSKMDLAGCVVSFVCDGGKVESFHPYCDTGNLYFLYVGVYVGRLLR